MARTKQDLSAIGALAYSPHARRARFFLTLVAGAVRSANIIRFLEHLHQHQRGPLIVIWGGAGPHRSKATREFIESEANWLTVVRLPAYAPDLNPVEAALSYECIQGLSRQEGRPFQLPAEPLRKNSRSYPMWAEPREISR